jgi:hypothetical protein
MKIPFALVAFATTSLVLGAGSEARHPRERFVLLIPSSPPKQKLSEAMQTTLKRLQTEESFSQIDAWDKLTELPAWVSEKESKAEIAYVGSIPADAMDAFRYAVVIGAGRKVIVVRAGGFAGVYEIFQSKKQT